MACKELIEKYGPTSYLDFNQVKVKYNKSKDRYFFLDYDGTLTPIVKTPSAAAPGSKTLEYLKKLASDPLNKVFVISGRDSITLERWLGLIPNLGMSAEHGCFLKMPNEKEWQDLIADHNDDWKSDVTQIFEYFTERTPGSFIERKSASLTWHYRQCDPEFGSWQAKQCQSLLENAISGKLPVEILAGKKNLEVRPISINKGQTLRRILSEGAEKIQADFVFCAGDDRTDEDMFKALMDLEENKEFPNSDVIVTCTIGPEEKKTLAKFHVNNPDQLMNLLQQLTE
jgi:trehalose-phosphatase